MKKIILIGVIAWITLLSVTGVLAAAQTQLLLKNNSKQDVTVYLTLGATNGCIPDISAIPFVKNIINPLQGSFLLKKGTTVSYTPPQGTCFNGNLAFGSAPLNCAPAAYPSGINLFEFMLNNSMQGPNAQETIDISCVAGANAFLVVKMRGGGAWNAGKKNRKVTMFKNKEIGENTGLLGVYPYGCDVCQASQNPPQCPKPPVGAPNPPKPQAEAICNVQRSASLPGGIVRVVFKGFIPPKSNIPPIKKINKITLGPRVQTQQSADGKANIVPSITIINSNNSWFSSPNKEFILILQQDGNLVLYRVMGPNKVEFGSTITVKGLWDAKSTPWVIVPSYKDDYLAVQGDGNLVLYPYDYPVNQSIWSWPGWTPSAIDANLYLQDDGALVLYNGTNPVWTISPAKGC